LCLLLESTQKRKEETKLIADFLKKLSPNEVAPAVLLIIGAVFPEFDPRTLDVGWKTVNRVLRSGGQVTLFRKELTIREVHRVLSDIAYQSGSGSRRIKEQLLEGLLTSADKVESEILVRIIFGEMRIGVNEGVMLEALSEASDTPLKLVIRALMMTGNIGQVAEVAIRDGGKGLSQIEPNMFVPLKPMLANMVEDPLTALEEQGETAFEYKYDGARIQIHRRHGEIKIFSRRLSDVTESLPDIIDLVKHQLGNGDIIIEGEVIATGEDKKPLPFQDLMRRFTRVKEVSAMTEKIPLQLKLFDILYMDGHILIDEPYNERWKKLEEITSDDLLADRLITKDHIEAEKFMKAAIKAGHEGLMAKRLTSNYTPGSRGKNWLKIKPAETLDVVITAADWGTGRRRQWLSNYHLAVWNGEECLVIGKTFKGLTDSEFDWITKRLQTIKRSETEYTVSVRPELVVEVAFNEIQRSPHYKSGYALRFARITRIREDKSLSDADTLKKVRELYEMQFRYKAKVNL
jgi:DNA ligase-1